MIAFERSGRDFDVAASGVGRVRAARRPAAILVAGLLLALLLGACDDEEPRTLRLFDGGWRSLQLNNAIAAFLLTHGYGYEVELVAGSTSDLLEDLPEGRVDFTLEGWQQNALGWYEREIAAGRIENLGTTFEAGRQFFIIPRWLADELGLGSVFDLRAHWEVFADPRDPSKGVIVSCVVGSRCAELNVGKLQAYDLDRHFNLTTPASYESLESTIARAEALRVPLVGAYWTPSALVSDDPDWVVLREPAHTPSCELALERAIESGERAAEACGYPLSSIDALASAGVLERAPDAVEFVRRFDVGLEPLVATLRWAEAEGIREDWERAAIHYLDLNRERWQGWLTPEARERVETALANLGAGREE